MTSSNVAAPTQTDLVRCLACGTVYAKPVSIMASKGQKDCPKCGYVGWLSVAVPIDPGPLQRVGERFHA